MVQCASGSHSRFSDHDLTVYEDYYRKYPNFIGWNFAEPFVKASGAMPIMEHVLLTGETVIDGPETIPVEVSREKNTIKTKDGYTRCQWGFFPHFVNINIDEFRKILDGTVRIPTRREVIDRTKICIKNDYKDGSQNSYIGVGSLFDGLYRPECDHGESDSNGNKRDNTWLDNHWWLKITGRYPAIPQLCELLDEDANQFEVVLKSGYNKR